MPSSATTRRANKVFRFMPSLSSNGPSYRLLQAISRSLSRQHASYVTRSKPSPHACVATRRVFSAFHSLSRRHPTYATMNVPRSGEYLTRTCMNCGSLLENATVHYTNQRLPRYRSSSFGWNPRKKKTEMFDPLSRFVIVRDISDPTGNLASSNVIA